MYEIQYSIFFLKWDQYQLLFYLMICKECKLTRGIAQFVIDFAYNEARLQTSYISNLIHYLVNLYLKKCELQNCKVNKVVIIFYDIIKILILLVIPLYRKRDTMQ